MATSTALSLPILPSQNQKLPSPSPAPIRCRMRRWPPTGGHKANCRKVPPKLPQIDTPVSAQMPAPPLRCGSDEGKPLLDSRNFAGEGDLLTTDKEEEIYSSSKDAPHGNKSRLSDIGFFGVDLSPDNVAVAMVYFVQGVLGLSRLAVSFYLKDDLHLDPAETALISGVSALPWLIKPLYGFISDSFPLFGYRRRSYLVLSGLLGALSWSLMANSVDSKFGATLCILLGSLSVAFSDVLSLECQN